MQIQEVDTQVLVLDFNVEVLMGDKSFHVSGLINNQLEVDIWNDGDFEDFVTDEEYEELKEHIADSIEGRF